MPIDLAYSINYELFLNLLILTYLLSGIIHLKNGIFKKGKPKTNLNYGSIDIIGAFLRFGILIAIFMF